MEESTTIRLRFSTVEKLRTLKIYPRETDDDLVTRLVDKCKAVA